MAVCKNVDSRVIHTDIDDKDYNGDYVDSPLRLAYTLFKNKINDKAYFLTFDWSYRIQSSQTGKIFFNLVVTTAYEVDFSQFDTTASNIESIIMDGFHKLKLFHDSFINKTCCFSDLAITDIDNKLVMKKVEQILSDLPEYNLK